MKLKEIFVKPVDRTIEGVIKADDLDQLKLEVEEYVVTNEISKRLEKLVTAYNDFQGSNGVWISGFFGSGKSHLLKMLACLLENSAIDGKTAFEYFGSKFSDSILKGDMRRAVSIPSKSILFNIDQKAVNISKEDIDAVLSVFVKVFNELQGYFGNEGYVAQFEQHLDEKGLYQPFMTAFADIAGIAWEKGREQIAMEKINVAKAFAKVTDSSVDDHKNLVDVYRKDYKLSIEDFAKMVKAYIDKQEPGFRLNFFVDEVGQYVADNVKLMTNLQTIAESLATVCDGQSWVFVTAQEDMENVLGEFANTETNDFSKIQDRFKTRLKLTSQNVDEVIQKRLLKKNAAGEKLAKDLYQEKKNNFGTLFDFADGATTYRNFRDEQHFIDSYPFIPYQFGLFKSSIEVLSQHNAFEGKHSSVGERSMLGVFQQVVVAIADHDVGQLATFDQMFEGIRSVLKSQFQSAVLNAENQLQNTTAIRVLKALFLVKHIKGFNATLRNIRVLMQNSFDRDIPNLEKNIQEALDLLEQQTYIQRTGTIYDYLTDEEKNVEVEIKNVDIDSSDVEEFLDDILFSGIIKDRRMRYDATKQDYSFAKKLDDRLRGREQELAVHFVTPFSDNIENIKTLQANSLGRSELMIVLPPNSRFMNDVKLNRKTEKYIKVAHTTSLNQNVKNILRTKGDQNQKRLQDIQAMARELISKARFFVSGDELEVAGEDPKTRIVKGFNELVTRTYPNLRMLGNVAYSEDKIREYLSYYKTAMLQTDLPEAEQEVFAFIQSGKTVGTRTTMKGLEEKFTKKPYGWYLAAIQCITAILASRGKIEVKSDANILDDNDLENALKNTHGFKNLILEPQPAFPASQIRGLKDFYSSFFDQPASSNEAKALGNETREMFRNCETELKTLAAQKAQYPFLSALEEPISTIGELSGKDYSYFIQTLPEGEDDLLDMKEQVLDPIRRFMNGANKGIYDEAQKFVQEQAPNFEEIGNGKPADLRAILAETDCYRGNRMKKAKELVEALKTDIEKQLEIEKKTALDRGEALEKQIHSLPDFKKLDQEQSSAIKSTFNLYENQIEKQDLIAMVRDKANRLEGGEYTAILSKVSGWTNADDAEKIAYARISELNVPCVLPYLENEADVEAYVESLKKALLKAIKENKRITF